MKATKKWVYHFRDQALLAIALIVSHASFAQTARIGKLEFTLLKNEKKPAETVYTTIHVFEENVKNSGRTIPLYIEVLPARIKINKQEPMFILMGGPGQAATDLVSFFAEIFGPLNEHRDIVFIDQRGTGKSNPLKLSATYAFLQDYFNDEFLNDSLIKSNYQDLKRKADLTKYGTLNATIDLETVRKAMGYDRINLYGTSYGTRLALSYIKKYPSRVRTATLKGVVPDRLVIPYDFAEDAQHSLDKVIEDCANIDSCRIAFPFFNKEVQKLFSSAFPVRTEIKNPQTGVTETVNISREAIGITLRVLLLSPSTATTIPYLITQANKNNWAPLANMIIAVKRSYITGLYDGMSLCVTCFEDYPLLSTLPGKNFENTFLGTAWVDRIKKPCAIWNPKRVLFPKQQMRSMPTQVLLISSERDPATPPGNGENLLKYFPNGKHLVVKEASHSFNGMTGCIENIICDFVKAGNSKALNTECAKQIRFPGYKLN